MKIALDNAEWEQIQIWKAEEKQREEEKLNVLKNLEKNLIAATKDEDFANLAKVESRIGLHNSPSKAKKCPDCFKQFDTVYDLKRHVE